MAAVTDCKCCSTESVEHFECLKDDAYYLWAMQATMGDRLISSGAFSQQLTSGLSEMAEMA